MKRIGTLLLVFGLAALGARAQMVTGSGTTNTIPKFTGSTSVGDSPIVEFNGNIGIGTTTPVWPLHVFSSRTVGSGGYPQLPSGQKAQLQTLGAEFTPWQVQGRAARMGRALLAKAVKTALWAQQVQPTLSLWGCSAFPMRQRVAEVSPCSVRHGVRVQSLACLTIWRECAARGRMS
jgi:hypothetical protein